MRVTTSDTTGSIDLVIRVDVVVEIQEVNKIKIDGKQPDFCIQQDHFNLHDILPKENKTRRIKRLTTTLNSGVTGKKRVCVNTYNVYNVSKVSITTTNVILQDTLEERGDFNNFSYF